MNLKNMKDTKKSKQFTYSSADCEKIESEYASKRKQFNSMMGQIFAIEEKLEMLTKQQKAMHEQMTDYEKNVG